MLAIKQTQNSVKSKTKISCSANQFSITGTRQHWKVKIAQTPGRQSDSVSTANSMFFCVFLACISASAFSCSFWPEFCRSRLISCTSPWTYSKQHLCMQSCAQITQHFSVVTVIETGTETAVLSLCFDSCGSVLKWSSSGVLAAACKSSRPLVLPAGDIVGIKGEIAGGGGPAPHVGD